MELNFISPDTSTRDKHQPDRRCSATCCGKTSA